MSIYPQLAVNSLITGSIYALVASGLALSYGLLRILNFAHGHLMMVGAYIFFLFYVQLEWPVVAAGVTTALVMLAFGTLVLAVFVRPFTAYSYHLPLVTTFALATILESLISIAFGVNVKSISIGALESYEVGSVFITPVQIVIIASALVLLCVLAAIVHGTPVGRAIRALRENPFAAQSLGVGERRIAIGVFSVATLLAGFAGVLIGIETNMQPTMGNSYTIKAFACMILGGLGNIWGTIAGAYILGAIENFSIGVDFLGYSLPSGYKDAFAFVIILLVLLIRPGGLFGAKQRVV